MESNQSEADKIQSMEFRFIEWNERRASRSKEAARVAVIEDGAEHWLWMSKADIGRNMMAFGRHPELEKAHAAYRF